MNSNDLLEPIKLYQSQLKEQHHTNVVKAFDELQSKAKVDEVANKTTCKKYYKAQQDIDNIAKKLSGLNILRVLLILLIVGGSVSLVIGIVGLVSKSANAWIGLMIGIVLLFLGIFLLTGVVNKKIKQDEKKVLTEEQQKCFDSIANDIENEVYSKNLIFGITGSRKN